MGRTPQRGRLIGSRPHLRKFCPKVPFLVDAGGDQTAAPDSGKRGQMGDVIMLAERREARRASREGRRRERSRAEFFFDLSCPFTYLAAERVERAFDDVVWTPASAEALRRSSLADDTAAAAAVRRVAEERA